MANGTRKRRHQAGSRKRPGKPPVRRRRTASQQLGFWLGLLGYFLCFFSTMTALMLAFNVPPALSAQRTDVQLQHFGESTVGEVVEVRRGSTPHGRPGGGRSMYRPVTEQLLGGVVVTKDFKDYASTRDGLWAVGQQLPVRFDPSKSKRMSIDTPEASALLAGKVVKHMLQLKVAAAAAVAGSAVLIAARRIDPPRRRQRKRNHVSA